MFNVCNGCSYIEIVMCDCQSIQFVVLSNKQWKGTSISYSQIYCNYFTVYNRVMNYWTSKMAVVPLHWLHNINKVQCVFGTPCIAMVIYLFIYIHRRNISICKLLMIEWHKKWRHTSWQLVAGFIQTSAR